MAILDTGDVIATALWPQGDIRDPLGVWGFRKGITGDASGGGIKVTGEVPAGQGAAYVYTCYSVLIAQLTGTAAAIAAKSRLLTNWPNIDTIPGVQGYAVTQEFDITGGLNFTAPLNIPRAYQIGPAERFILLFDPRPRTDSLPLVELELNDNENLSTYSFEGYGYFWDRSVLNAPGGPRHPGSS